MGARAINPIFGTCGDYPPMIINPYAFSAFNPLSLSPALWLDASDAATLYNATSGGSLVSIGGGVARWEDKSGNAKHALQPGASGKQPLRQSGGIDFDGTDDALQVASIALPTFLTVFFVGEFTTAKPFFIEHSANATSNDGFFFYGSSNSSWYFKRAASIHYVLGSASWAGAASMIGSLVYNGAGAYYKNGSVQSNTGPLGSALSDSSATTALNLCARNNGAGLSDGLLKELLVFPSALGTTDRQAVEAYLNSKWAIY